ACQTRCGASSGRGHGGDGASASREAERREAQELALATAHLEIDVVRTARVEWAADRLPALPASGARKRAARDAAFTRRPIEPDIDPAVGSPVPLGRDGELDRPRRDAAAAEIDPAVHHPVVILEPGEHGALRRADQGLTAGALVGLAGR